MTAFPPKTETLTEWAVFERSDRSGLWEQTRCSTEEGARSEVDYARRAFPGRRHILQRVTTTFETVEEWTAEDVHPRAGDGAGIA